MPTPPRFNLNFLYYSSKNITIKVEFNETVKNVNAYNIILIADPLISALYLMKINISLNRLLRSLMK